MRILLALIVSTIIATSLPNLGAASEPSPGQYPFLYGLGPVGPFIPGTAFRKRYEGEDGVYEYKGLRSNVPVKDGSVEARVLTYVDIVSRGEYSDLQIISTPESNQETIIKIAKGNRPKMLGATMIEFHTTWFFENVRVPFITIQTATGERHTMGTTLVKQGDQFFIADTFGNKEKELALLMILYMQYILNKDYSVAGEPKNFDYSITVGEGSFPLRWDFNGEIHPVDAEWIDPSESPEGSGINGFIEGVISKYPSIEDEVYIELFCPDHREQLRERAVKYRGQFLGQKYTLRGLGKIKHVATIDFKPNYVSYVVGQTDETKIIPIFVTQNAEGYCLNTGPFIYTVRLLFNWTLFTRGIRDLWEADNP